MAYNYPYGNGQQLNLDWFLNEWKNLLAAWKAEKNGIEGALQAEIDRAEAALADVFAARDAAAQSAANALESKNAAAQSAEDASGYLATVRADANTASNAAQNAAQSESNAVESAQTALASKNAAGQSERNAAQSEANALASKNAAAQSAADALADKNAAAQSASDAENAAASVEEAINNLTPPIGAIVINKLLVPDFENITVASRTIKKEKNKFLVSRETTTSSSGFIAFISGDIVHVQAATPSQITPHIENLLPKNKYNPLKACCFNKQIISSYAAQISTIWYNVEDENITYIATTGNTISLDDCVDKIIVNNFTPPSNATHFAIVIYIRQPQGLNTDGTPTEIIVEMTEQTNNSTLTTMNISNSAQDIQMTNLTETDNNLL